MSQGRRRQTYPYLKIAGRRISINVMSIEGAQQPRLRFDKVAIGLVKRLQLLSASVPDGKVVVVTVTAPIWQDSKTGTALEVGIRELLSAKRMRWKAAIYGNQIEARVLKGGAGGISKLIGFVHNPKPGPSLLFDVTSSLLEMIGSGAPGAERWLLISNQDGGAPFETVREVCLALGARSVFKKILLEEAEGVKVL